MDELFDEWDAERGAPSADVTAWAERELDRAFAEQAAAVPPDGGVAAASVAAFGSAVDLDDLGGDVAGGR